LLRSSKAKKREKLTKKKQGFLCDVKNTCDGAVHVCTVSLPRHRGKKTEQDTRFNITETHANTHTKERER
jgi:hypothetical protein